MNQLKFLDLVQSVTKWLDIIPSFRALGLEDGSTDQAANDVLMCAILRKLVERGFEPNLHRMWFDPAGIIEHNEQWTCLVYTDRVLDIDDFQLNPAEDMFEAVIFGANEVRLRIEKGSK